MQNTIIQQGSFTKSPNCLNTVRLLAAISVFYIHALSAMEVTMPIVLTKIISFFQGVPIFFALSGFFIWDSVGRSSSMLTYARKRIMRIYPELWTAVLLSLLTILALYDGPIDWLQLGLFTFTQSTILQFWTPDFLRSYGCGTPNGSLWTIGVTVQFYIVIFVLYKWLYNRRLRTWVILLVGAVVVAVISPVLQGFVPEIIYKLFRQTIIPYAWWFLLGTIIAAKRNVLLPLIQKHCFLLLTLSAMLMLTGMDIPIGDYRVFCSATLIFGVIGFGYRFPKWNVPIDISYEIYIYHMIVINATIALGFTKHTLSLLVVFVVTLLLAIISERTVGQLAMRLKTKKQ